MTKTDEFERSELLNGEIVPRPQQRPVDHNRIMINLTKTIAIYLHGKTDEVFSDDVNLHLDANNRVTPDVMIVRNRDIIKKRGVYGAPDFVVEVMSPNSAKRDMDYKKNLYERCGVKEYWIVNPKARSVIVYHLVANKYILDNVYHNYSDEDWAEMTPEEQADVDTHIKLSIYDDFDIALSDIFARID